MLRIFTLIMLLVGVNPAISQLYLNEASNANGNTILDPLGGSPDWIELYNASGSAVDLSGYGLSDKRDEPLKWQFPAFSFSNASYLTVLASGTSNTLFVDHWETAVRANDTWSYLVPSSPVASGWNTVGFVATGWSSGMLGIGYGDGDDLTTIASPATSVYVRRQFNVSDPSKIVSAILDIDFDDGFVAYLNGVEIARSGLGGNPPAWDELATDHEATLYQGQPMTTIEIDPALLASLLVSGTNVLAIEVHNSSPTSSDLSLIPYLSFAFSDNLTYYMGTTHPNFNASVSSALFSTGFTLSTAGEKIFLSNPDGIIIDSLDVPDLEPNMSVGRFPDAASQVVLFTYPTPGETNNGSTAYNGFEEAPTILTNGGFYTAPVTVSIQNNSTTGGVLRYTLTGQEPNTFSPVYSGPITVSTNKVLKVKCFPASSDLMPSANAVETYLIGVDHTLPVISISTDPSNLVGANGIFDNFNTDWRKPCVIEYFDADGMKQFESRASIKPDGGAGGSRSNPQHSVTIEPSHGLYGEGKPVEYPLIPEKSFIQEFHAFYLRNGSNYWNQYPQKDATFMRIVRNTHANSQAYTPVVAYVNGEYFGVYELREKANERYFEGNYGNDPDSLDLLSVSYFYGAGILRTVDGSDTGFYNMRDFVTSYPPSNPDYFERCHEKLDLYNFTDYISAENWFGNVDWVYNNMKIARTRTKGNRWRFFLQDMELGLGGWVDYNVNIFDYFRYNNQPNPYWQIYDGLMQNTSFRNYFVNRYADLMNTVFQPEHYAPILNDMYYQLVPEMPQHFEKWTADVAGGMANYANNRNNLLYQFQNRNAIVREQIVTEFGLAEQVDVTLDVEPAGAGYIKISTIIPDGLPWTGVYFDGVPVKMTAVANPGYTFSAWEANTIIPGAQLGDSVIELNIPYDGTFKALFTGTPQEVSLTISEVHYNPDASLDGGNWIELHNYGAAEVNLTGWRVKSKHFWDNYEFPDNTVIPSGAYLVVCQDTALFHNVYPSVLNFIGATGFPWSNSSDSIQIYNQYGDLFLNAKYRDELPYPLCADGWGRTLENSDPNSMVFDENSWFCGCIGGSPGKAYEPCEEDLVISEINFNNSNSEFDAGDWLEIFNNSSAAIDLTGYVFKDRNNDHVYALPSMVLQPGAYTVISNEMDLFGNRHPDVSNVSGPFDFSLSGNDVIRLYDITGVLVNSVVYNSSSPWPVTPAVLDFTLEYRIENSYLDVNDVNSWFAGCEGGSPGRAYTPCPTLPEGENGFLYPNPTTNVINVVYDNENNSSDRTMISVFDASGRLVIQEEVIAIESIVKKELDVTALRNGLYYVRIEQSGVISQLPFVKL